MIIRIFYRKKKFIYLLNIYNNFIKKNNVVFFFKSNFFKSNFFKSNFFKSNFFKSNFFKSNFIFYFIYVTLSFVFIFNIFIKFYFFNILKNSYIFLILIFFFYFFITTYFHFSKTYNFNKYTSQTQRFWKRTFGVFWALEFFLFFIYMYLTLISPSELPMYAINYKEIITSIHIVKISKYHFIFIFILILINFLYFILLFLKKKNNYHFFNIIFLILNFLYCFILYFEFLKFYYIAGWGTHSVYTFNKSNFINYEFNNLYNNNNALTYKIPNFLNNSWLDYSNEKQWLRTFRHFIYILLILKFWHAFLIYFYFCLCLLKFIENNKISFDVISSNHQNSIYLIWFYIFSYILILKKKIYFLLIIIYKMTFTHINFINIINSLNNEFNIIYIF